jgi:hypothetical protein
MRFLRRTSKASGRTHKATRATCFYDYVHCVGDPNLGLGVAPLFVADSLLVLPLLGSP